MNRLQKVIGRAITELSPSPSIKVGMRVVDVRSGDKGKVIAYPLHYGEPEKDKYWAAVDFYPGGEVEIEIKYLKKL